MNGWGGGVVRYGALRAALVGCAWGCTWRKLSGVAVAAYCSLIIYSCLSVPRCRPPAPPDLVVYEVPVHAPLLYAVRQNMVPAFLCPVAPSLLRTWSCTRCLCAASPPTPAAACRRNSGAPSRAWPQRCVGEQGVGYRFEGNRDAHVRVWRCQRGWLLSAFVGAVCCMGAT